MVKIKCKKCGEEFSMTKKELFPPKPVPSLHTQAVVDMIEIFSVINPTINYGHRGYRADAEVIIGKFGVDKALNTAKFAVQIQGQQFAPTITTPTALRYKLGDLLSYYKKNAGGRTIKI